MCIKSSYIPVEKLIPAAVAMLGEYRVDVSLAHRQLRMMPRQGEPLRRFPPVAFAKLAIVHVGMPTPDVHALHITLHMQGYTQSPVLS